MSQHLYFLLKYGTKQRFELSPEKDKFYIGRSPDCDISVSSVFASRIQCEISRIPNKDSLQLKNISTTNSTYIDNIQLSVSNPVAQVKVGSIIGLGVPLLYINDPNPQFIFLKVCKESTFQRTVEPKHFSQTCNNLNDEKSSSIPVIKKSVQELPIKQYAKPDATVSHNQVPNCINEKSVYDSPEPTKKFMQGGSFLTDGYDIPSTSKQVTPLNSQKCKPNFGAQEIHDVIIIDDDDDDLYINSSHPKNNLCPRSLENIFIKKETNEYHETKKNTKIKSEPKQLIKNEICAKIKNGNKPLEREEINAIFGKEFVPIPINCVQNATDSSHTHHNSRCNSIIGNVNDATNYNNEHLPCVDMEVTKSCLGVGSFVLSKQTSEQVPNKSLCSINNIKSKEDEKAFKTSIQDSINAKFQYINQEYEYDYLDFEDASILEQIIVDETISKDKFINFYKDVKPNVDILQANLKNSSASTLTNCNVENKFNKLNCESVAVEDYKKNSDLLPESIPSNSWKSVPHNLSTENSHPMMMTPNRNDVKLISKNKKPYKPMVYLPTLNMNIENISNSNKCSTSNCKADMNDSPKHLDAGSLKRTYEENDNFNLNAIDNQCKKRCTDLVFKSSKLKINNSTCIHGLKDCKVLISPLKRKKNCNLPNQPGQLSTLLPKQRSQSSDSAKFIKINQPPNNNQNMDEFELHMECSPLKPVQINKSVNKRNVIYSSDSDTSDSEVERNPSTCRNEKLDKLNEKVDLCTKSNDNPDYFICKPSSDSRINEKENIFPIRRQNETNPNVTFEKILNTMSSDSTIKNEVKDIINANRVSSSEEKEFPIKMNNFSSKHSSNDISYKQNVILKDEVISPNIIESKPLRLKELKNDNAESTNEVKGDIKCEKLLGISIGNKELDISDKAVFNDVKVKEEHTENMLSLPLEDSSDVEDNDTDIINYSQMDDIIYISSDDETDIPQDSIPDSSMNVSFGPLPPSPEREFCFEEIEQESDSVENDLCGKNTLLSNSSVVDSNFKINKFVNDEDSSNSKNSGKHNDAQLESNDEDWWPSLSQDFDSEVHPSTSFYNSNETAADKFVDADVCHNAATSINNSKNGLDYVIEKIKKKKSGTTLLTEPKIPPARKKVSIVRKHKNLVAEPELPFTTKTTINSTEVSKVKCIDDANTICSKLDESGSVENQNCLKVSKKKLKPSEKVKRKNSSHDAGSLRIKIMKTHNLDPYKKIADAKSKERHHLISSSKVSELKQSSSSLNLDMDLSNKKQNYKRVGSSISVTKGNENISVKPRSSGNKGIAKNITVSRSQKLTEVNLFKSPTKPKSKPKFKIPKKTLKPLDVNLCNKENTVTIPILPVQVTSVMEKRVPTPVDCFNTVDENLRKTFPVDSSVPKGILKSPTKNQLHGPRNRVTFPRYDEDLCKVTIISPRKKNESNHFTGPRNVKLKEIYIKGIVKPSVNISIRVENPQVFIYNICNWNYDWLCTYQKAKNNPSRTKMPNPPKVCESTMLPTLTVYSSYDDYQEVFSNLMYYETWENIYKDWEQHLSNNTWFQCLVDSIQPGFIKTKCAPLKYCTVKIFIPINKDLSMHGKHPNQGSLIAMKHKHNNKTISAFGYVQSIVKKTNLRYMPQELKAICKNNEDTVLQLSITFSKLYLENSIKPGMLVAISNVSYVRPSLRAYEALCQLKNSPLCPALLNPGIICSMKNDEDCRTAYIIPEITLNGVQKNAVINVSDACTANLNQPKISLIHGPPGTGKTRTITALIAQINLLYKEKKLRSRRILLCAPSNAAVDELTYKLMKLREVNLNLNIVRFGVEHSFSQQVNECSFETKVRKEFEKRITQCQNKSVQQELQQKKQYALSAIEDYEKALKDKKCTSEIKQLEIRMIELLRSEKDLQDRSKNYISSDEKVKLNNDCKKMILMQAEVIACTLNSCLSGAIFEIFSSQPSSFACCIVDEAGQCKETETWMPLQLGISRLILVGDHLQLPATVLSTVAQGKKLHQSLFERVYHHVGFELQNKTVIHSLTLQYRMHEDICVWPSNHFYYGMLHTAPGVSQERKCFLRPVILFDLEDSSELNEYVGEICNKIEVQAIMSILDCIAPQLIHFSVGILTPYQKQRILLTEKVKPYNKDINIKVSTIDNFQGQEKDLIICSFVRANVDSRLGFVSDRQRLNVALTRARRALIVIGHMQSLKSNEDWKSLIENCQHRKLLYRVNLKLLSQKKELYKLLEAKR